MKKFLLVALIILLGTFIYIKVQVLGDPNSSFNQTTRYNLGKRQFFRSIFGLHSYGDARYEYLSGDSEVSVEMVKAQGVSVDEQTLLDFTKEVKTYTGRPTKLFDTETVQRGTLSDADLAVIAKGSRHHVIPGQSNVFVVYAEDFQRSGDEVAKTFSEFGIVISDKRLREATQKYPASLNEYLLSTLLHELGHQLGLEHNDQTDCIMNPQVENPTVQEYFNGRYTATEFCDFELKQLDEIKAKIK